MCRLEAHPEEGALAPVSKDEPGYSLVLPRELGQAEADLAFEFAGDVGDEAFGHRPPGQLLS